MELVRIVIRIYLDCVFGIYIAMKLMFFIGEGIFLER